MRIFAHREGGTLNEKGRNYCRRCGHMWNTKVDRPVYCPECKSRLWDCIQMLWSCGTCGNLKEYRDGRPAPAACPRCSSASWKCVTKPYACTCGYSAHFLKDSDAVCPVCKARMHRSGDGSGTARCGAPPRVKVCSFWDDPIRAEVLERIGKGQHAITVSREMGIPFETVMRIISD